jgi:hypothetical protein
MLRRLLAIILVLSWVTLSAFDLLEDLNGHDDSLVHSAGSTDDPLPNGAHPGQLVNNILEWGDRIGFLSNALVQLPAFDLAADAPRASKRSSNIHKLHCVFLI